MSRTTTNVGRAMGLLGDMTTEMSRQMVATGSEERILGLSIEARKAWAAWFAQCLSFAAHVHLMKKGHLMGIVIPEELTATQVWQECGFDCESGGLLFSLKSALDGSSSVTPRLCLRNIGHWLPYRHVIEQCNESKCVPVDGPMLALFGWWARGLFRNGMLKGEKLRVVAVGGSVTYLLVCRRNRLTLTDLGESRNINSYPKDSYFLVLPLAR